tara:strand:+ start:1232 stop:1651 length:420 start_codon:yes stop_codon:yes gene_type:complete
MKPDLERIASFITENPDEILTEDEIREQPVYVVGWDEIGGDANTYFKDSNGDELTLGKNASDGAIAEFLDWVYEAGPKPRAASDVASGDHFDDFEDEYVDPNLGGDAWRVSSISRSANTATVEMRSDSNHLSVSVIIWI